MQKSENVKLMKLMWQLRQLSPRLRCRAVNAQSLSVNALQQKRKKCSIKYLRSYRMPEDIWVDCTDTQAHGITDCYCCSFPIHLYASSLCGSVPEDTQSHSQGSIQRWDIRGERILGPEKTESLQYEIITCRKSQVQERQQCCFGESEKQRKIKLESFNTE